jgi:DNA polymerase I-like protein with 3'-5' exonuclease and polymerase domains
VNKEYIQQRINIFAGKPINPASNLQVKDALLGLKIKLPQKTNLDDALNASNEEHEIVKLIIQYRKLIC